MTMPITGRAVAFLEQLTRPSPRGPPHTTRRTSAHVGACVADRCNRGALWLRVVARQPLASNSQHRPVRCSRGPDVAAARCTAMSGLQRGPFSPHASFAGCPPFTEPWTLPVRRSRRTPVTKSDHELLTGRSRRCPRASGNPAMSAYPTRIHYPSGPKFLAQEGGPKQRTNRSSKARVGGGPSISVVQWLARLAITVISR